MAGRGVPSPTRSLAAFTIAIGWLVPRDATAQSAPAVGAALRATPGAAEIRLDGSLDEAAWRHADSIADLIQVEPVQGARPVGRTVVRALVSSDALIIGIMAYDPQPSGIVSYVKARDGDLQRDDHVRLLLDTFRDERSGYVFAVNPAGARYDALVSNRGESENASWDAVWEAAAARTDEGWSVEIRIPVRSIAFAGGLQSWGFNIERRVQRLQETSRWAAPTRDARVIQASRAGLLTDLPPFDLGVGVTLRPALTGGATKLGPGLPVEETVEPSLDASQRLGPNLLASLTLNTDFAETEVDARQANLTRFPLFFPEKRTFFLEGTDIFDFGLGLREDLIPFFSRRVGLIAGQEVPLIVGGKLSGRVGPSTSVGALAVRNGDADTLAPAATMGAVRVRQDVLRESSVGAIATFGDPLGRADSWLAGGDFTFQTSHLAGDKNFLVGVWGLAMDREDAAGDRTAAGFKVDYPNDLWDVALTYRRVGDGFQPSLGFVPRPGVHSLSAGITYAPRPRWSSVRQMRHQLRFTGITDLDGHWESYRAFTAPINWRLESGDRVEFNIVPQGERLLETFAVVEGVEIPTGEYHFTRWRLEAELAAKRPLSGQLTWWFGGFYTGTLHQLEAELAWKPSGLLTLEISAERNVGRLPQGDFTTDVLGTRIRANVSPDFQVSSFVQWDTETRTVGSNTRLRWTFDPLGDLFVVYNHNLADRASRLSFDGNALSIKLQYAVRL